mmetsp:Transcript_17169/g.39469  ORF Transcript_17169/g.39469 Transcript_17169/m.39469 type:complete len:208 (+) Transcript_17169:293-916(+)
MDPPITTTTVTRSTKWWPMHKTTPRTISSVEVQSNPKPIPLVLPSLCSKKANGTTVLLSNTEVEPTPSSGRTVKSKKFKTEPSWIKWSRMPVVTTIPLLPDTKEALPPILLLIFPLEPLSLITQMGNGSTERSPATHKTPIPSFGPMEPPTNTLTLEATSRNSTRPSPMPWVTTTTLLPMPNLSVDPSSPSILLLLTLNTATGSREK